MSDLIFSKLAISDVMSKNLQSLGYEKMTPIQSQSLPHILNGRDVMAQAKTGSGKTAAFGIGALSKIDLKIHKIQVVVLCPTRELADQVAKELRRIGRQQHNLKVLTLCGGTPMGPQIASLEHGAHCVVGTPGRICDHLSRRTLNLRFAQTLILDEADRMLDMGFTEDLDKVIKQTPKNRQTLLFSATYPENIQAMSERVQRNSVHIVVEGGENNLDIEQKFYEVKRTQKSDWLVALLAHHQPESSVVFCNTKKDCSDVANALRQAGFVAEAIHGDLEQKDRDDVLALFSNKSISILVATDVAARGLDIKDLSLVCNYEPSRNPETHVHRVGRTGRAGNKGLAITLYSPQEERRVLEIEKMTSAKYKKEKAFTSIQLGVGKPFYPKMQSLCIHGGKKHKLRPTDILGALTAKKDLLGSDVGKIMISDFHSFVALKKEKFAKGMSLLSDYKIKGREFKVRKVHLS
ncbi:MAG: ATP-dependent RNA helicase DbpA [Oligoflexales bacterium]